MAVKTVFADEMTEDDRRSLLGALFSEVRYTISGRKVLKIHTLENMQFYWLAKELGYKQWSYTLKQVLLDVLADEPMYRVYFKKKRKTGFRKILAPTEPLKEVQRKTLDNILVLYPVSKSAFGYSGGNVFDAIEPHLSAGNLSLFSTDIKDAFGSVDFRSIFWTLYGLPLSENYLHYEDKGYLSWEVAYVICRLLTCAGSLPQGAPSSPRLFDLVFRRIDLKLERLAGKVGGVYTRFADNLFFSMPQEDFPDVIGRAIVRAVHENHGNKHAFGLMDARRFECHKSATRLLGDEAIRVLGVNVAGGKISPTRQLKRRIRLSIHRLNWLMTNTSYDRESILKCWGILQGQMSFASQATLPKLLLEQYDLAKCNYEELL